MGLENVINERVVSFCGIHQCIISTISNEYEAIFADIERTSEGFVMKDTCVFLKRYGYLGEYVL